MAEFNDFDVEIQDLKDSEPEQFNGEVTTAGSAVNLTPTSTKDITLALIKNPGRGPNSNNILDVLLIIIDGGSNVLSLSRGESIYIPGVFTTLTIDATNNNTNYEVILWS